MLKKILFILIALIMYYAPVYATEIDDLENSISSLDQYLTLENSESQSILEKSSTILLEEWRRNIKNGNWTEKIDPFPLVEIFTTKQAFNYFVLEYPGEIIYDVGKEIFSLAKLVGVGDISGLIGKFEEMSVDKAIEYATQELFKREVRVGFGGIILNYQTNKGEKTSAQINYIITRKQITNKDGSTKYETVLRFYSPKSIKVHNGIVYGRSPIEFVSNDLINPFIITIKGYTNYYHSWIDNPEVSIDYPEVVPDFGFKKASFFEKKVITPIKEWLKTVNKLFDFFSGSVFDSFSSKTLERIEENESLKEVSEEIKVLEQEIEESIIGEEEGDSFDLIQEKFSEEDGEENEESPILRENMTDEEIRTLLIAIYNELKKRKEIINELKEEEKKEVEDSEDEESKKEEEKKEIKDEPEIVSYCSYNNQSSLRSSLIINEIAWMGTNNSSSDEWIELKNISNQEVDLNNYQLLNKDNEIKIIFKDLKIAPGGYILLERTDDTSVPGIIADLIYKGGLSNSSESIYLFNSNCVLEDVAEANPNWPAGDNSNKKSMERKSDLTWKTYSGDSFGTPRTENSQESSVVILPSGGGTSSDPVEEETPITYCSQTDLEEALKTPVIINEVAWMGTDVSSSDEWIELKNLTDENISLNGWQLLDKDNNIKIVFDEKDVILANNYYLLERTDDTTVSSVLADKIYVGALNNTDESLRLFNSSCLLIDAVVADSDWPAGETSKSMERKSDLTWKTYSGDSFGTPRAENSAEMSESSSYCLLNGGVIEKRTSLGGDYSVCVFDDGKECEEEAMYSEKCPLYGVDVSFYSNDKEKYCALKGGEVDVMGENLCNFPHLKTCDLDDLFNGKCSDNIYATSLVITEINDGYNRKEEREYVTIFNQSGNDIFLCSGEDCIYLAYFVGDETNPAKWNNPVFNIPLSDLLLKNNSSYQIDLNKNNRGDYAPALDPIGRDGYLGISNASLCLFNGDVELLSEENAKEAKIDCVGWRRSDEISYNNIKEGSEIYKSGVQFNQALFRVKETETNKYLDRENNITDFINAKPTVYTIPDVSNFTFTEIEDKTKLKLSWDFDSSLDVSKLSYKIYYTEDSFFDEDNLKQISEEDTIKTGNHIETIVPIQQDIDYRFRVVTFEDGGNVSDNTNFIFYVSFSSFYNHPYGLFRYNSNKTNNANYLGPKLGVVKNNLIESDTIFRATPLIDQFGNLYVTQAGEDSGHVRVASYDKNGLLRWKVDLSEYFAAGNLILRDSLYYFSKGTMVKFSHSGQKVWEKSLYGVTDPDKYLYYNDKLYFSCSLESKGLCEIDFNPDSFLNLIYNSGDENLSNLLVDELGNIFFVVRTSKLIKLDSSFNKVGEVIIESEYNPFINMVNNKILISSQTKEILVDASTMKIIFSWIERPAIHKVFTAHDGFYIFEATYLGSLSSVSFLNVETEKIKLLSDRISRLNFNDCPPVVDSEGNFYYLDINGFISGYSLVEDSLVKVLDENIGKTLATDLILLDNMIYLVVDKNLIEASFE